jgi:hypothetical protein
MCSQYAISEMTPTESTQRCALIFHPNTQMIPVKGLMLFGDQEEFPARKLPPCCSDW